ncbi:MAG TPA: MlaD family protein [Verrucomicrobiae bacterium]|nr:MlaD family protein [Verrucomicrobiae bacterium]
METAEKAAATAPRARVRRRARFSLIWLVPLIAGIAAAVLVANQLRKIGPTITIQFEDGSGLDPNQTVVRFRGVRVGKVHSVHITPDTRHVRVEVRLDRSAAALARRGTVFWVVRPEVGAGGIHALETIVSGPYIDALPGAPNGRKETSFVGANEPPLAQPPGNESEFILRSPAVASLSEGSPVFYRGIEVGSVEYLSLSEDATMVEVHVLIKNNFVPLVRTNTVWWNAGGINVDLSFLGVNLNAENLKSMVVGGISFATPDDFGPPAGRGAIFTLYNKAEAQWLDWAPAIPVTHAKAMPGLQNPAPNMNFNGDSTPKQQ